MSHINQLVGNLIHQQLPNAALSDNEVGLSRYIQVSHFISPAIFSTKEGALGCVIRVEGMPFEVEDNATINYRQASLSGLLQYMDDELGLYVSVYRHPKDDYPKGDFTSDFACSFNTAYAAKFKHKPFFVNSLYVTLMVKPSALNVEKGLSFIARLSNKKVNENYQHLLEKRTQKLQDFSQQVMAALKPYKPSLLGLKETATGVYSEPLSFLGLLVNGHYRELSLPETDISAFISDKRLFIGDNTLHWVGNTEKDNCFGALLSIKHYASYSQPGMLNDVLRLPFSFLSTHGFFPLSKNDSIALIKKQQNRLTNVNDAGFSEQSLLTEALDDVTSNRINFGMHHHTLLIYAKTQALLEERVAIITQAYNDMRFIAVRETTNLHNAFFSQLPGNFSAIRRSAPITSHNFSSMSPLHNFYSGYTDENHLGGSLMLFETQSKTPFYLNLHERGSGRKEDITKGFTTIIAPSNAGKTALMMAFNAMFQKYGLKSYIIDRKCGCEIYVNAMRGTYIKFSPSASTGMNPFQLADTPENAAFLRRFLYALISHPGFLLTPEDEAQIAEVVSRNFQLPLEARNLSTLARFFKTDFKGRDSLDRWLKNPLKRHEPGEFAWIFDNETDTLNLNADITGFDMTYLLAQADKRDEDILTPVNMYLFYRIEQGMDGRLTGVFIDEGWQILNNPYWQNKIEEYMFNWRKQNGFIVFATQSPEKVAKSVLGDALIQGSATNIYLGNHKAQYNDYVQSFQLSPREYDIIKTLPPRHFLFKQGDDVAILHFDMTGLEAFLAVFASNETTLKCFYEAKQEAGDEVHNWLPLFQQKIRALV